MSDSQRPAYVPDGPEDHRIRLESAMATGFAVLLLGLSRNKASLRWDFEYVAQRLYAHAKDLPAENPKQEAALDGSMGILLSLLRMLNESK